MKIGNLNSKATALIFDILDAINCNITLVSLGINNNIASICSLYKISSNFINLYDCQSTIDIVDGIAVSIMTNALYDAMQRLFISIHTTIQAINWFFSLILMLITLIVTQTGASTMIVQPINGSFVEQLCIYIMCIMLKTINDTMKMDRYRLISPQIALMGMSLLFYITQYTSYT